MKRNKKGGGRSRNAKRNPPTTFRQDVLDEEHIGLGGLEAIPETQVFFPPRETDLGEDNKKRLEAVRRAWKTLSVGQKKILALIENGGYTSLEEIANTLNLAPTTVYTQLERARAKIIRAYNEQRIKEAENKI